MTTTPTFAPRFSLAVYCGSKPGHAPQFAAAAQAVGQWIGRNQGQLVYGGGRNGLMGIVAEHTRKNGGRVVGVTVKALLTLEGANHESDELHVVDTMHQRKQMMMDRADAFLTLAGGIGTFEELFEVWTWRQLGYHNKPLGLLNTSGHYDPMLAFMAQSVSSGFMSCAQMDLIAVHAQPQPLLEQLVAALPQASLRT